MWYRLPSPSSDRLPRPKPAAPAVVAAAAVEAGLGRLRESAAVRLDAMEAEALAAAVDGIPAEQVDLFGSRVRPESRGGDIDLLIYSTASPLDVSRRVSCRFFARCEERIDVVVIDQTAITAAQRAFLAGLHRVRLV